MKQLARDVCFLTKEIDPVCRDVAGSSVESLWVKRALTADFDGKTQGQAMTTAPIIYQRFVYSAAQCICSVRLLLVVGILHRPPKLFMSKADCSVPHKSRRRAEAAVFNGCCQIHEQSRLSSQNL